MFLWYLCGRESNVRIPSILGVVPFCFFPWFLCFPTPFRSFLQRHMVPDRAEASPFERASGPPRLLAASEQWFEYRLIAGTLLARYMPPTGFTHSTLHSTELPDLESTSFFLVFFLPVINTMDISVNESKM